MGNVSQNKGKVLVFCMQGKRRSIDCYEKENKKYSHSSPPGKEKRDGSH